MDNRYKEFEGDKERIRGELNRLYICNWLRQGKKVDLG